MPFFMREGRHPADRAGHINQFLYRLSCTVKKKCGFDDCD